MARLFAGTSGFAYPAWKPDFYPKEAKSKDFLRHYAARLNSVEINYTYHRLPSANTIEGWLDQTPDNFVFACKAHMRITHILRLKKAEFNDLFFKAIDPLRVKGRLGPVLFQLPPNFQCDQSVLAEFLSGLPADVPCAFEFRNKSWLIDPVYEQLEKHNAALCLAESDKLVIPERITANFVYFRLRKSDYPPTERAEIATRVRALLEKGKDTYVFFKHEETPAGALYAQELLMLNPSAAT
jgi:uncharacterized protein YecE (DUF72 family)